MVSAPNNKPHYTTSLHPAPSKTKPGKENRESKVFEKTVQDPQSAPTAPTLIQKTVHKVTEKGSKTSKAASDALPTAQPVEDPAKTKLKELKSTFSDTDIIHYTPKTQVETGAQSHLETTLLTLMSCQKAAVVFAYNHTKVKQVLAALDLENPSKDMAKKIKEAFVQQIPKSQRKEFLTKVEIERGKLLPKHLEHTFEVNNQQYAEKREFIDNWASVAYLETFGNTYQRQITFIEENSVRNGPLKNPEEVQGMLLNGQVHTFTSEKETIDTVLRSGAFCVHGDAIPENDRLHLSVAQALAKITIGIDLIASDPKKLKAAMDAGELLYVEQSFLSTGDSKERKMCKDMKAAMDYLAKHAEVRFSDTAQGISMKGEKIVITIKNPNPGKFTFRLRPILFVEGVNEKQSAAQVTNRKAIKYQEEINTEARQSLLQYAEKIERTEEIAAVGMHFSDKTKRDNKDIKGVKIIRDAVETLGGIRGISCKTGKDRTGAEASDTLASKAAKDDEKKKNQVRDKLAGGISYHITGQNTGKQNAYAFNSLQYQFIPEEWRPPKQYCGSGPS